MLKNITTFAHNKTNTMTEFEVELNGYLYCGKFDVAQNSLDLYDVIRCNEDETQVPVNSLKELRLVADKCEDAYSDDIRIEREELFFDRHGRLPDYEQDY